MRSATARTASLVAAPRPPSRRAEARRAQRRSTGALSRQAPFFNIQSAELEPSARDASHRCASTSSGGAGSPVEGPRRLQVAVDLDEVLGQLLVSLNAWHKETHGVEYHTHDYDAYDFARVWGVSRAEMLDRVHAFYQSEAFLKGVEPVPGAVEALTRLASEVDLHVVTARQVAVAEETEAWLARHFPRGTFRSVQFGNHHAKQGRSMAKREICDRLGADVLVDDNPLYATECAQAGYRVLLFDGDGLYPWTRTSDGPDGPDGHPNISRCTSWEGVVAELRKLAAELGCIGQAGDGDGDGARPGRPERASTASPASRVGSLATVPRAATLRVDAHGASSGSSGLPPPRSVCFPRVQAGKVG